METIKALTSKECIFAEKHHYLVDNFLRYRRLPYNEFYDVVIFRYLRSVQLYLTDMRLRRFQFSTIVNRAMDWAVKTYWKHHNDRVKIISLDHAYIHDGTDLAEALVTSDRDICDEVCDALSVDELLRSLSQDQSRSLSLKAEGYTENEIALQTGKSKHEIHEIFAEIKSTLPAQV